MDDTSKDRDKITNTGEQKNDNGKRIPENTHPKDEKHDSQTESAQSIDDAAYATSYTQADDAVPDESNKSSNP
jgi:hypothetical protein